MSAPFSLATWRPFASTRFQWAGPCIDSGPPRKLEMISRQTESKSIGDDKAHSIQPLASKEPLQIHIRVDEVGLMIASWRTKRDDSTVRWLCVGRIDRCYPLAVKYGSK